MSISTWTDQRLVIPERGAYSQEVAAPNLEGIHKSPFLGDYVGLSRSRTDILKYYEEGSVSVSPDTLDFIFDRFERFHDAYTAKYVGEHQRVRGGDHFEPYAQLTRSLRYDLLRRLDQLELISVEHNYRSVDQKISSILLHRCMRSPHDHLRTQPICSCGFRLGETIPSWPLKELGEAIDKGIKETLEALRAPNVQEKILHYLEGLELVGKKDEAAGIRRLLDLTRGDQDFLDQLNGLLGPRVIQGINEAFRGRVVVVKRDVDQLYQSLVHRKYTLAQTRRIFQDWLKEEGVSEGTFLHFVGRGETESGSLSSEGFEELLEDQFQHLCEKTDKRDFSVFVEELTPGNLETPSFQQCKREMVEALKTYQLLRERSSALKPLGDLQPEAFSRWESMFIKNVSLLPYLRAELHERLGRIGTRIPPFLRQQEKALNGQIDDFTQDFKRFYLNALSSWERGKTTRPLVIEDIPAILTRKRNVPEHREVRFVLMDGMRWDLWDKIKTDFFGKVTNLLRVLRDGVLWASQPTNTAAQLARFERSFQEISEDNSTHGDILWKVTGIDEKTHSEKGPLTHLFANVISYLEMELLFKLRKLPSKTLLVIFSDHGFVENPAFWSGDKYETPRYVHGKDSPFEVVVPWAWVLRL